jgi:isopentenyldiphosphate isomerase
MPDNRMLNIVDENGDIVGEETRENIHERGLLHQEIHVWFYTPQGEIIFQHRAKDKDTYPDLLDATVGGHVEIGSDYIDAALQEIFEETGVVIQKSDLFLIKTDRIDSFDERTKRRNNVLRTIFAYRYTGEISELKIEEGKAIGFEAWPISALFGLADANKKRFIPTIFKRENIETFKKIKELL